MTFVSSFQTFSWISPFFKTWISCLCFVCFFWWSCLRFRQFPEFMSLQQSHGIHFFDVGSHNFRQEAKSKVGASWGFHSSAEMTRCIEATATNSRAMVLRFTCNLQPFPTICNQFLDSKMLVSEWIMTSDTHHVKLCPILVGALFAIIPNIDVICDWTRSFLESCFAATISQAQANASLKPWHSEQIRSSFTGGKLAHKTPTFDVQKMGWSLV